MINLMDKDVVEQIIIDNVCKFDGEIYDMLEKDMYEIDDFTGKYLNCFEPEICYHVELRPYVIVVDPYGDALELHGDVKVCYHVDYSSYTAWDLEEYPSLGTLDAVDFDYKVSYVIKLTAAGDVEEVYVKVSKALT